MPAIENPTLFARLRRTTMNELLRGRLSSGYTPAMIISTSGLDASTKSLITDICKLTKLWNAERVDVARELVAHFADGKDAGVPSDKLIRAFGDPAQAAKLIRRAKIRNRSLFWHAKRFLLRAAGVIVVLYLGLAVYYSFGKPKISVDYVSRINESILAVPADQRAWPIYRQFAEAVDTDPIFKDKEAELGPAANPRQWPRTVEWIKANPRYFELLDQATQRPSMGFIYGANGSAMDLAATRKYGMDANPDDPFFNSVIGVLLPQLNYMRTAANILSADARLAMEQDDSARWMRRIGQIRQVGIQSREPGFLVNDLVHVGIEALCIAQIERMLIEKPSLLSDNELAQLAHQGAYYQKPSDLISFDTERYGFADVVQRLYTDDGHGDGHLSTQGIGNFQRLSFQTLISSPDTGAERVARFAASPAAALLMASRKELMQKYTQAMDAQERQLDEPWRLRRSTPSATEKTIGELNSVERMRYLPLTVMLPSLDRAGLTAERIIAKRDAINVAIALELFKRKSGSYPATLAELSPTYLPTVPLDPCDGQPMRYKLVDGKPVVYSIGTDFDDDGGVKPFSRQGFAKRVTHINGYELAIGAEDKRLDGDWLLFPELISAAEDSDADENATPATQPAPMP
jgi:hypothetical protein